MRVALSNTPVQFKERKHESHMTPQYYEQKRREAAQYAHDLVVYLNVPASYFLTFYYDQFGIYIPAGGGSI